MNVSSFHEDIDVLLKMWRRKNKKELFNFSDMNVSSLHLKFWIILGSVLTTSLREMRHGWGKCKWAEMAQTWNLSQKNYGRIFWKHENSTTKGQETRLGQMQMSRNGPDMTFVTKNTKKNSWGKCKWAGLAQIWNLCENLHKHVFYKWVRKSSEDA